MARKSLASLAASTVVPVTPKAAKPKAEPKAILSESVVALSGHVTTRMVAAGVAKSDLPTPKATASEVSSLFVGQAKSALLALAAEATSAAKSLTADGVTLKPKADTGRIVVCVTPENADGIWSQATISITLDGALGQAVRDLFPQV